MSWQPFVTAWRIHPHQKWRIWCMWHRAAINGLAALHAQAAHMMRDMRSMNSAGSMLPGGSRGSPSSPDTGPSSGSCTNDPAHAHAHAMMGSSACLAVWQADPWVIAPHASSGLYTVQRRCLYVLLQKASASPPLCSHRMAVCWLCL